MSAPILEIDPDHPQPRHILRAANLLREGGLIAYPTDTQYGLGCLVSSKKALQKLYALKRRDSKRPVSLLCPDLSNVASFARVSNFAYRTMRKLVPGPFTFVLEASREVPDLMMTKQKQVGIRVPDAAVVHALCLELGAPLASASATTPDGEPLVDARDIKEIWGHGLDLILDGGVQLSEPSTILSLIDDQPEVLRQGKGIVDGYLL